MFKNVASQKLTVFAFADAGHASLDAGEPVTGDAAQITLKIEQDDDGTQSASNDVNPTEVEDGQYRFDLTQAETNGDKLTFYPQSSTAGVQVIALPSNVIYTRPQYFSDLGIGSDGDVLEVNTLTGHTAQTGDSYARLGAPAGASVSADIAENQTDLNSILADTAEIGAAGAGLTAIPWNASWDAEVQSEVNDGLVALGLDHLVSASVTGTDITDNSIVAYLVSSSATADWDSYVNTTDSLQAIRDRGDSDWTTGGGGASPQLLQSTTIATLATQTSFTLTAGSADDDAYNGAVAIFTDSVTSTQKAFVAISDYTGATKTVTLSAAPAYTIAVGDTVDIVASASDAPTAASIRAEIDSNSTQLAAIVADTNELQTDWANGGRLDLILDATATASALATVDANVDAILVDTGTTIPASITTLQSDVTSILSDTNELQTDWANGGRLDLILDATATASALATVDSNVDAILVDTGTTIPGTITTMQSDVTSILADTNELQGDWTDGGRLDLIVDAILVDTGTTLPAAIPSSAAITTAVLTTQMTESYAAQGTPPTLAQAMFWLYQDVQEAAVSGTTKTITKLDQSTAAGTVTLDDGTNPTSLTRAT